jgi:hypothetical protein
MNGVAYVSSYLQPILFADDTNIFLQNKKTSNHKWRNETINWMVYGKSIIIKYLITEFIILNSQKFDSTWISSMT